MEPVKGIQREDLYTLTGTGGEKVILGVIAPWLVISSDRILPDFASASARRPANSLAHTNIMPDWQRNISARGVLDPTYAADRPDLAPLMRSATPWLDPSARLAFTARVDSEGGIDANLRIVTMSDQITGGGAWPVVKLILFIVWLVCLALIVIIVLAMIGWSGWLKVVAMKAGAKPKDTPSPVAPSPAFKEDAGAPAGHEEDKPNEARSEKVIPPVTGDTAPPVITDNDNMNSDATEPSKMHDTPNSMQKDK